MKTKYKVFLITIIIGVLISIIVGLMFLTTVRQVSYFYDKDLGLIKTEFGVYNWFNKFLGFFQQAIVFTPNEINLGETVHLRDDYTIKLGDLDSLNYEYITGFAMEVIKDGSTQTVYTSQYSTPKSMGNVLWSTVDFIPNTAGLYSGNTRYFISQCTLPDHSTCYSSVGVIQDVSTNSVNVIDPTPPACTKEAYCDEFSENSVITGGKTYKKVCYTVDDTCNYVTGDTVYETRCDNGYVIKDTTNTIGSGVLQCVLPVVVTDCTTNSSLCILNQTCNNATKLCVDKECNVDTITSCSDNSTIITHKCINGVFNITHNICPTTTNTTITNTTNITSTINSTCWIDKTIIQQTTTGDSDLCISKIIKGKCSGVYYNTLLECEANIDTFDTTILWIIGILGGLVLIVVIVIVIVKGKSKKRK